MKPETETKRLAYSVHEIAGLIGVGRTKAYELVRTGEIRCVRAGRRLIVPIAEINRYLSTFRRQE